MVELMKVALIKHEVTEQFPECVLEVEVRLSQKRLYLDYHLAGSSEEILLPVTTSVSPAQKDGLWEHTCFEAFLGMADRPQYCEFNLSPSGDWAAYAFQDYRERSDWIKPMRPEIELASGESLLRLSTCISLDELPEEFAGQPLMLGLSAVLESNNLSKSWWAIEHAKPEPDFHLQCGWIPLESLSSKP